MNETMYPTREAYLEARIRELEEENKKLKSFVGKNILEAIRENDIEFIKAYIEAKGNLEIKDVYGHSLLHLAAMKGQTEIAQTLIGAGADTSYFAPEQKKEYGIKEGL